MYVDEQELDRLADRLVGIGEQIDEAFAPINARNVRAMMSAACETMIDNLFDDFAEVSDPKTVSDPRTLAVLSGLPARFARHYDELFVKKFIAASISLTIKVSSTHAACGNVAEELAYRCLLDEVEAQSEILEVPLPAGWRARLEDLYLDDVHHEYLYDPAADGFEDDPAFGPPGMAPMQFAQWFVPFGSHRYSAPYATD